MAVFEARGVPGGGGDVSTVADGPRSTGYGGGCATPMRVAEVLSWAESEVVKLSSIAGTPSGGDGVKASRSARPFPVLAPGSGAGGGMEASARPSHTGDVGEGPAAVANTNAVGPPWAAAARSR